LCRRLQIHNIRNLEEIASLPVLESAMTKSGSTSKSTDSTGSAGSTAAPTMAVPRVLADMHMPSVRDFADRLRFDPAGGRIWLDERRVLLMHAEAFASLRNELVLSLGVDTARGLLTRIGYAAGCRDAEFALRIATADHGIEDVVRWGAVLHALQGFVLPEIISTRRTAFADDNYHGEWIWKNSIEDEYHVAEHGVGDHAVCWTEVGYSSGYLSTCAGRRILVREVECRAQGAVHCRNIAKPVGKWENAEEDLRFLEPQPGPPARVFGGFEAASPLKVPARPAVSPAPWSAGNNDIQLVGASAAFHALRHHILRVAPTNATVLLLGESGVGKSLVARELHRFSQRAQTQFVEINCAAIPETLIEAELFGVERGAYSGATTSRPGRFEAADGGTLFLDEIGTLSLTAQGKLLRVLQNGELERLGSNRTVRTDVRLLAATNEDLKVAVREGQFREDLYYRLNVFPITIQPLRDRRDDIPLLTEVLLARFCRRHQRTVSGITHLAMRAILHHAWPGNIRELENVLERGVILANDGEPIDLHHLQGIDASLEPSSWLGLREGMLVPGGGACAEDLPGDGAGGMDALAQDLLDRGPASLAGLEDAMVRMALRQAGGNVTKAATLLGLTRSQMDYRVKKLSQIQDTVS
jgi:DNA-binding NtrC family response regulator/predicted hydrocarbon binding protein